MRIGSGWFTKAGVVSSIVAILSMSSSAQQAPASGESRSKPTGKARARFGFGVDGGEEGRVTPLAYATTLRCTTEVFWGDAYIEAASSIFSPTSRHLKSSNGSAWSYLYHQTAVTLDTWSRPGNYMCFAQWNAYTGPGGIWLDGDQANRLVESFSNTQCGCMAPDHNRALTRTQDLYMDTAQVVVGWPDFDGAVYEGAVYWNEALNDFQGPMRVQYAPYSGGVPVVVETILDAGVVAMYTNQGGPERLAFDPEYYGALNADQLHHVGAHEVGHALGIRHAGCSQTASIMFETVNVNAAVIGVFDPMPAADRCTIRSEYGPPDVISEVQSWRSTTKSFSSGVTRSKESNHAEEIRTGRHARRTHGWSGRPRGLAPRPPGES